MSKEQIEEMAKVYEEARCKANETLGSMNEGADKWYANAFYNAGYRKQSEWISVDERLPDEAVRVLVWLAEPSAILRFVQFDTDRMVDGRWVRWNNHITHWMPLPEPPKMKGGAG